MNGTPRVIMPRRNIFEKVGFKQYGVGQIIQNKDLTQNKFSLKWL